jgi:hypothetical protein
MSVEGPFTVPAEKDDLALAALIRARPIGPGFRCDF